MNYHKLVKERKWKQPLLGMFCSFANLFKISPKPYLAEQYHLICLTTNFCLRFAVALSYSVQILDDEVIPVTPNDFPIDAIVSPSGMILISPAALERCR